MLIGNRENGIDYTFPCVRIANAAGTPVGRRNSEAGKKPDLPH